MMLRIACLLVAAWPALAAVPTPESYFGHPIGADRTVMDWDKVVSYFHALAGASDRIRVEELGKTADGRQFIAATIADAARWHSAFPPILPYGASRARRLTPSCPSWRAILRPTSWRRDGWWEKM